MTQKPMYAAMVNSPVTEIVADISVTDTEIELLDATKLPTAPNLAVIGSDETAETVRYTEVNGNVITVERGFQGAAKSWSAGTKVARYFTAYDHDSARENIEGLYDRLDAAESEELTLQPGVQLVTAKRDARFKLGAIKGKTEINGQGRIGIIGVENPYVTRVSGNLLPPFYEWNNTSGGGAYYKFHDPYVIEQYSKDAANHANSVIHIPVIPGQTYTLNAEITKNPSNIPDALFFYWLDADGNRLPGEGMDTRKYKGTYTAPSNARFMQMYVVMEIINDSTAYKTQIVTKPTLTVGSDLKPFTTREDAILAYQTELHANPNDGSEPDELFDRDGQYFKLAKWKKSILDGSESWLHIGNNTGFKSLGVNSYALDAKKGDYEVTLLATKYNGQKLKTGNYTELSLAADVIYIYDGGLRISVSNADSGWGDNYTPTPDEIKAYFMGYRMYLAGTDPNTNFIPYNGTGSKSFGAIQPDGKVIWIQDNTPPSTVNTAVHAYNLLYKLASPTVEPITSEGCLTLTEGDNQIEVGTGIVLRERANPVYYSLNGYYYINNTAVSGSLLKNKVSRILRVYRNNRVDNSAKIENDANAYGTQHIRFLSSDFDTTAAYSVTYLKLDKSPVVPITGTLAANEKAQLTDLTAGIQEALQRVSVVEQKKAEKDQPVWITPTLLNGWVNFGNGYFDAAYIKDSTGSVRFRGLIRNGAMGQPVFVLPVGYRPSKTLLLSTISNNNSTYVATRVEISPTGMVTFTDGSFYHLSLDAIPPFLAEQ